MISKSFKIFWLFLSLIIIFIIVFFIDFRVGHVNISFSEIIKFLLPNRNVSENNLTLIKEFRFPRVMMAFLAGAALSVSGLVMQTIFRNPLAGPYVLGISSGAGLGVAIVVLGTSIINFSLSNYTMIFAAIIGALLILLLILIISLRMRDTISILIIGILISGVVTSIVNILQYYATDLNVKSYVIWTMGSLSAVSYKDIKILLPLVFIFSFLAFLLSKKFNLLMPGEQFAKTMGVNIKTLRILSFIIVSVLTGVVTAFCGPLGFIGIAVPHVARWIFNSSNHFLIIPASFIIGGIFLMLSDIFTHIFASRGIIPVNAVTAIIGAPLVIWIVLKNKRVII